MAASLIWRIIDTIFSATRLFQESIAEISHESQITRLAIEPGEIICPSITPRPVHQPRCCRNRQSSLHHRRRHAVARHLLRSLRLGSQYKYTAICYTQK